MNTYPIFIDLSRSQSGNKTFSKHLITRLRSFPIIYLGDPWEHNAFINFKSIFRKITRMRNCDGRQMGVIGFQNEVRSMQLAADEAKNRKAQSVPDRTPSCRSSSSDTAIASTARRSSAQVAVPPKMHAVDHKILWDSCEAAPLCTEADNNDFLLPSFSSSLLEIEVETILDPTEYTIDLLPAHESNNWLDIVDSENFGLSVLDASNIGIQVSADSWFDDRSLDGAQAMPNWCLTTMDVDILGGQGMENWFDFVERRFDEEVGSALLGTVR